MLGILNHCGPVTNNLKFGNSRDCVNRIAVCLWLAHNKIPHGYETYDLAIHRTRTYLNVMHLH